MFQAGKAVSAPSGQGADHFCDWMETTALYWCSYSLYKYNNDNNYKYNNYNCDNSITKV